MTTGKELINQPIRRAKLQKVFLRTVFLMIFILLAVDLDCLRSIPIAFASQEITAEVNREAEQDSAPEKQPAELIIKNLNKVEVAKAASGKEIISITGVMPSDYDQNFRQKSKRYLRAQNANGDKSKGKSSWVSLPHVSSPAISKTDENGVPWFVITTGTYKIEIEENKAFGVDTAKILEGFYRLLKKETRMTNKTINTKLRIRIFKGKRNYESFCEEHQLNCDRTMGVTSARYLVAGGRFGRFVENQILFYWDNDWRKFENMAELYSSKQKFYATLFHEATHQLLHTFTQNIYPKWLGEGLAEHFENTMFNGKEIYLPMKLSIPRAKDMKEFLNAGGDPKEIFSWDRYGDKDSVYYGFSASFVAFLMRGTAYRHYIDQAIRRIDQGESVSKVTDSISKIKDGNLWDEWRNSYTSDILSN